jgi:DNA helicase-2/ATP-dependent DNA helicase PcrA
MKYILSSKQTDNKKGGVDYEKELNEEQLSVVREGDGACLVLAGAGSGKTRTLVYRVLFLLEKGISPENILLMTFTNKAASEMLHRVETYIGHQKGMWGGTFHSLGHRVLRQYGEALGYKRNFSIIDEDDSKSLLKNVLSELSAPVLKEKYFPKAEVIKHIFSYVANSVSTLRCVCEERFSHLHNDVVDTLESIHSLYEQKKRQADVMDFDDLLTNWHSLLRNFPACRQRLSSQFQFILVDEYQDTNKIQGLIIDDLAGEHGNILVVGDDAQSIYSFRAANISNILEFPKRFPHSRTFRLETNYRSTPEILALANHIMKGNGKQFQKNLRSVRNSCEKPVVVICSDSYQQADFVCKEILEFAQNGQKLSDMAVLFRSSYQMIELELSLNKRNIPYVVRGGIRFFEQAHIKDLISYIRVLSNFHDEIAWIRVLGLYPGIGAVTTRKILQYLKFFESLENFLLEKGSNESLEKVSQLRDEKAGKSLFGIRSLFRRIIAENSEKFLSKALDIVLRSGYDDYVKSHFENAKDRLEDLSQLILFSKNYESIEGFLADVALSEGFRGEKTPASDNESDKLLLTTIHQAKGLEWRSVFVIGMVEGQFPHRKVFEKHDELDEERRLFYVACTRAKEYLFLISPIFSGSFRTGQMFSHPSSFLKSLPNECYDQWEIDDIDLRRPGDEVKMIQYD